VKKTSGFIAGLVLIPLLTLLASCLSFQEDRSLFSLQEQYRRISSNTLPVIVEITTVEIARQQIPNSRGWPWDFMYPDDEGQAGNGQEQEREYRSEGVGSGILIERTGETVWVVTNYHVVENAERISVRLYDGSVYAGSLRGYDSRKDIALIGIMVPDREIPLAKTGNSDTLEVGDFVLAAGHPFGYSFSVTTGVVSALHRSGPTDVSDFIQTDAAINQGNSGGALVNLRGEIIGINTWITTPTGGSIGLGFAIPINSVKRVVRDLVEYGEVRYAWLGASVSNIDADIAASLGLYKGKGAFIAQVFDESPAVQSDILPGDIVTVIAGKPIETADDLIRVIGELFPGDTVTIGFYREGTYRERNVALEIRKKDEEILKGTYWPGISVYPLTAEISAELGLSEAENGILVYEVMKGAPFSHGGVRINDIIQAVNGHPVNNLMDFYRLLNDKEYMELKLALLRNGQRTTVTVTRARAQGRQGVR
jgi:Do/DeqQ family serine protease